MNNQAIINERINKVMSNPKLKNMYILEYKRETGRNVIDEGLKDWLSDKFNKAKEKAKEIGGKISRVSQGVVDIVKGGSSILGGEETYDIEKRKSMIGEAEKVLNNELNIIAKQNELGKQLQNLKSQFDESKFPNNKDFEDSVYKLKEYYIDVEQALEQKKIDEKTANVLIAVLRHLVIYYQDYKIHDKYLYLNEQQYNNVQKLLKEQEEEQKLGKQQGDVSKSYGAAYSAKLPVGLALAGISMFGLGIAVDSPAFQSILEKFKDVKTITQTKQIADTVSQVAVGKGEGLTQVLQTLTGENFGPNAKLSSLTSAAASKLLPALKQAVIAKNPNGGAQAFDSLIQMAQNNPNATLSSALQGSLKGTGQKIGDLLDIDAGTYSKVLQQGETLTNTIKLPQDTIKNQFIKYMGNNLSGVLSGLGIATAVGGAVSAGFRLKGYLSSRMSTLKKLVDSFKDLGGGLGPVEPPVEQDAMFHVKAGRGGSPRRTSLKNLLDRELKDWGKKNDINISINQINSLIKGITQLVYDDLKGQGALVSEAESGAWKPSPEQLAKYEQALKNKNKKMTVDTRVQTAQQSTRAFDIRNKAIKAKFYTPFSKVEEYIKSNYPSKETMESFIEEVKKVVRNWVTYQRQTSQRQKRAGERHKEGEELLGINESQIVRWKQLAGILKD